MLNEKVKVDPQEKCERVTDIKLKRRECKATGEQTFNWGGEEVYRISENLPCDVQCSDIKTERLM